jgi:hypothetical protein
MFENMCQQMNGRRKGSATLQRAARLVLLRRWQTKAYDAAKFGNTQQGEVARHSRAGKLTLPLFRQE